MLLAAYPLFRFRLDVPLAIEIRLNRLRKYRTDSPNTKETTCVLCNLVHCLI